MRLILDTYCNAGGASEGLRQRFPDALIVGVDNKPQKNYPFVFVLGDAVEFIRKHGHRFDLIWASPPCQRYANVTKWRGRAEDHPDLVQLTIDALRETGATWILENVMEAPFEPDVVLCGSMFGLKVRRHRKFLTSWGGPFLTPAHDHRDLLPFMHKGERAYADAMGCHWMTSHEGREAIPPAYARFLAERIPSSVALAA